MSKNIIRRLGHSILQSVRSVQEYIHTRRETKRVIDIVNSRDNLDRFVFYLGVTRHSNLGDLAQHYCILNWIKDNYPDYSLVEIEAQTVVDPRFNFIDKFKNYFSDVDRIIFQSGYTTQDLGGCHDLMHRIICENFQDAKILMMPQTVYFRNQQNKRISSLLYSKAKKMLFLARDKVSFDMAKEMFPSLRVELYPDIVTTLIGKYSFEGMRDGVCFCFRNDGEKFYSDNDLGGLISKFEKKYPVTRTDTTIKTPTSVILKRLESFIINQIHYFSRFKVVITDRYHGTIFSIAAGTPVIIIKTTDHKVVTGADWFNGVYSGQIKVAENLEEAEKMAIEYLNQNITYSLSPYFKEKFYDKLKKEFEE